MTELGLEKELEGKTQQKGEEKIPGVLNPKREPQEPDSFIKIGPKGEECKVANYNIEVVPGPMGVDQIGTREDGTPLTEIKAPNAIKNTFVEIPNDEKFEVIFRNSNGDEIKLFEGYGESQTGCKCVAMVRVRVRSDATGVQEPPVEEVLL